MSHKIEGSTLDFLVELSQHNNRDWFQAHKHHYRRAVENFHSLVQTLINGIGDFDPAIGRIDVKSCVFRIYRDIRFSPDKTPYKRHLGAYITPNGKNSALSGYYIHIEPEHSVLMGGIFMPTTSVLKSIREDIDYYHVDFQRIIEEKEFKQNFRFVEPNSLKRLPQGFAPGSPVETFIKMRNILPAHPFANQELLEPNFAQSVVRLCRTLHPLAQFLNRAIVQTQ